MLPGGQTVHSAFKLWIDDEELPPQLNADDIRLKRLARADIIIIDEISMLNKKCLVGMDKLLRFHFDKDKPFGGKFIILCGDFHQCPPVVPHRPLSESIDASIKNSEFYNEFRHHYLTYSKRLDKGEQEFDDLLYKVAKGIGVDPETKTMPLPKKMFVDSKKQLQKWTFDGNSLYEKEELKKWAILASKIKIVDSTNIEFYIL